MPGNLKVALLSYNTFFDTDKKGWVNDSLFLIQGENGATWAAPQSGPVALATVLKAKGDLMVREAVESHWSQLTESLPLLDAMVIYVGDRGSEHSIARAAEHGLAPEKAVFVFCNCNMEAKLGAINRHGFGDSRRMMCECGGHVTMRRIATEFLETGALPQ